MSLTYDYQPNVHDFLGKYQEGLGDSAIDMLGNKIDQINSSLANSSLDTDNKEKQMKKVDSRKSIAV